jgi:hypothetical protein
MLKFLGCGQTANRRAGGVFSQWRADLAVYAEQAEHWRSQWHTSQGAPPERNSPFQAECVAFLPFHWMNVHKSVGDSSI